MAEKRKDKSRTVLKTGEVQRKNGTYQFSWMGNKRKGSFQRREMPDMLRCKSSCRH